MEFLWAPLLGLCCSLAAADRHTVFWNSSNPKFQDEDFTVHVRLNDYLDIICPHYEDDSVADAAMERYTLYMVEHPEYVVCQPQSQDQVRWKCNQPSAKHGPEKLSEKFQRFTPFTLGKEFKEGQSYYYISKPIYHQESQCLKLRVTVVGKVTHSPQAHADSQEKKLVADDPEVQVLHSVGHSAAPRLFPWFGLCWSCRCCCCCKPSEGVCHTWLKDWNWAKGAGTGTPHVPPGASPTAPALGSTPTTCTSCHPEASEWVSIKGFNPKEFNQPDCHPCLHFRGMEKEVGRPSPCHPAFKPKKQAVQIWPLRRPRER